MKFYKTLTDLQWQEKTSSCPGVGVGGGDGWGRGITKRPEVNLGMLHVFIILIVMIILQV